MACAVAFAVPGCGSGIFGKQYEYEEDMTLALDGSATLVVNASLASLVALRGLDVPVDPNARIDRDRISEMFTTPVTAVKRVSRPWTRNGRRFVQIRMAVSDVRRLHEAPPFAWSQYTLEEKEGLHIFTQNVGASALKPGSLKNYGWNGSEIVAFRHHIPSKIVHHNSRSLQENQPLSAARGNILAWEQHLADRLDNRPVSIEVKMESKSILYRTLWLFGGAFVSAVILILLAVWWFVRKGAVSDSPVS